LPQSNILLTLATSFIAQFEVSKDNAHGSRRIPVDS
jgi:hypothetical protein